MKFGTMKPSELKIAGGLLEKVSAAINEAVAEATRKKLDGQAICECVMKDMKKLVAPIVQYRRQKSEKRKK